VRISFSSEEVCLLCDISNEVPFASHSPALITFKQAQQPGARLAVPTCEKWQRLPWASKSAACAVGLDGERSAQEASSCSTVLWAGLELVCRDRRSELRIEIRLKLKVAEPGSETFVALRVRIIGGKTAHHSAPPIAPVHTASTQVVRQRLKSAWRAILPSRPQADN
jgi:hypothetical protein